MTEEQNKNNSLVPNSSKNQPQNLRVSEMLYQDDPLNLQGESHEEEKGSFNERLRDLEVERQEAAQDRADEHVISDEDMGNQGYGQDKERGFDPLLHKRETEAEVEKEADLDADLDLEAEQPARKRKRGKGKFKAWVMYKLNLKRIAEHTRKMIHEVMTPAAKIMERVSTYRHHSIHAPGNQAGIFDNDVERHNADVARTIKRAIEARIIMREGMAALREAEHSMKIVLEEAAKQAMEPYKQQIEQGVELAKEIQGAGKGLDFDSGVSVEAGLDPYAQGVEQAKLGGLTHDAASIGMDIGGKGGRGI